MKNKIKKYKKFLKKMFKKHGVFLGIMSVTTILLFVGLSKQFYVSILGGVNPDVLEPNSIWVEQDSETQDMLFKFKNGQQSVETIKIYFSVEGGDIDLNNISTAIPLWEVLPRYSTKNDYFYVGIKSSMNRSLEKGKPIEPGALVEIMRISEVDISEHSKITIRTDKSYIGNKENTILQVGKPPLEVQKKEEESVEELEQIGSSEEVYSESSNTLSEEKFFFEEEESEAIFVDIDTNTIEGRAAVALYRQGIINGFSDGTFGGERQVSRSEATKFLLLSKEVFIPEEENNGQFFDVEDGQWYVPFVMKASELGMVNGYEDGTFRPANGVRRGEFLKMLSETFLLEKNLPHFYEEVAETWMDPYVGIVDVYNLFPSQEKEEMSFSDFLTRNEVSVALYQYLSGD